MCESFLGARLSPALSNATSRQRSLNRSPSVIGTFPPPKAGATEPTILQRFSYQLSTQQIADIHLLNSKGTSPTPATGTAQAFDGSIGVAGLVSLSISHGGKTPLSVAGILRGSDGTLWDFLGFLMAVSAH